MVAAPRDSGEWPPTETFGTIDYDHTEPGMDLRHVAKAPVHTLPAREQPEAGLVPPRRFANGTSPVTQTHVGLAPVRPIRSGEDDHTSPDIALDPTTPNLSLADATRPGLVLPSVRSRAAR
jgi:hypothetical protein